VRCVEWRERYERAAARYALGETRELDERQLVQLGNSAWAAGLSLLLLEEREESSEWLRRAAARYRESWLAGSDAWGRQIGAMKALLIAGDDAADAARWALESDAAVAESPIGRYAAALALLIVEDDEMAAHHAAGLQREASFPRDVADSLAAVANRDADSYAEAVARVRRSFEERESFLEDVPVCDTALALDSLAAGRGLV
jgi:hypothetical protein